jgi:hypothetical protein
VAFAGPERRLKKEGKMMSRVLDLADPTSEVIKMNGIWLKVCGYFSHTRYENAIKTLSVLQAAAEFVSGAPWWEWLKQLHEHPMHPDKPFLFREKGWSLNAWRWEYVFVCARLCWPRPSGLKDVPEHYVWRLGADLYVVSRQLDTAIIDIQDLQGEFDRVIVVKKGKNGRFFPYTYFPQGEPAILLEWMKDGVAGRIPPGNTCDIERAYFEDL